jgi:hypothetical protein
MARMGKRASIREVGPRGEIARLDELRPWHASLHGALLARRNGVLVPLPVASIDVTQSISGPIVRGRLVQSFENPTAARFR